MKSKYLVLIVGPTAVGKTTTCINLAKEFRAEIFSCDSRQFYKELNIGTAKPTPTELAKVNHHFINNLSIKQNYSVGQFEKEALLSLEEYFTSNDVAIMTGGSGLFAKAITHGFDGFPEIDPLIRQKVNHDLQKLGLPNLIEELKLKDLDSYNSIDHNNPQRVLRALEVIRSTGKKFSSFKSGSIKPRSFKIIKIALERPREELYQRINMRVDTMMSDGLLEEAKSVYEFKNHPALQTVGYKECFACIDGDLELPETTELIKRNTRRYAKRQLTWFKNQDSYFWIDADDYQGIRDYISKKME